MKGKKNHFWDFLAFISSLSLHCTDSLSIIISLSLSVAAVRHSIPCLAFDRAGCDSPISIVWRRLEMTSAQSQGCWLGQASASASTPHRKLSRRDLSSETHFPSYSSLWEAGRLDWSKVDWRLECFDWVRSLKNPYCWCWDDHAAFEEIVPYSEMSHAP